MASLGKPFRRINLNGLYALDAILNAASLTEAGQMVSLSQPAMSMSLRRMREHFGDELVRYEGGRRTLTALATELRPRIRQLLREADDTFHLALDFDPATAICPITIAAAEPVEIMLLSHLVPALLREAPGLEIKLLPLDYGSLDRMFDRGVDLAITPASLADPGLASEPLFALGLVAMVWERHPLARARLTHEDYLAFRHAALFEHIERHEFGDVARDPLLAQRRIVARTGLYSVLPSLVIGTDLIVTTTNWLAQYHAAILPLSFAELPMQRVLPPMLVQWRRHRSREPVMSWLIGRLMTVLERIGPVNNP